MSVWVEFYGIPRLRAGIGRVEVEAGTLGEVLAALAVRTPAMAHACVEGERLRSGYLANINGMTFTTNPTTPVNSGDCVLILSADVGG